MRKMLLILCATATINVFAAEIKIQKTNNYIRAFKTWKNLDGGVQHLEVRKYLKDDGNFKKGDFTAFAKYHYPGTIVRHRRIVEKKLSEEELENPNKIYVTVTLGKDEKYTQSEYYNLSGYIEKIKGSEIWQKTRNN